MRPMRLSSAFTLIEPGLVILIATHEGAQNNVMTIAGLRPVVI